MQCKSIRSVVSIYSFSARYNILKLAFSKVPKARNINRYDLVNNKRRGKCVIKCLVTIPWPVSHSVQINLTDKDLIECSGSQRRRQTIYILRVHWVWPIARPPTSSYNMCHYVSQMWDHLWGDREDHSMSTQIGYFAMNLRSQPINWWYTEGCNMRLMIVFWSSRVVPREIFYRTLAIVPRLLRSIFVDNIGNKPVHMSCLLLQALEL